MENIIIYESHVTVEPIFEDRLIEFKNICLEYKFRVAKLLLQNRANSTPIRSNSDAFCTSHDLNQTELCNRMLNLCLHLKSSNYKVWRYKIEAVIIDSRTKDLFKIIDI